MRTSKLSLVRVVLFLWLIQVIWLAWYFAPETGDTGKRLLQGSWGQAIREEDPYYRWLEALKEDIPPRAAYVFLDRYEAGKEIEARYHLYPRRHTLLAPQAPPSFLYFYLRRYQASYLLVRDPKQAAAPGIRVAICSPAFRPLEFLGPGLVFKVDYQLIHGDFYD